MFDRTRHLYQSHVADPDVQWSRRRLQILLAAGLVLALALVAGGVWSMASIFAGTPDDTDAHTAPRSSVSAEDRLAAKALPPAALDAAKPGRLSSGTTGTLKIPAPMKIGAVGVATGFDRTPEGALAQMASIDSAALSSVSVRSAQNVIEHWAVAGGPSAENWSGVEAVARFLSAAGLPADAQNSITLSVDPKMGFIKGTVGEGFVVPCVDYVLTATTTMGRPNQVAFARCQRMVWSGGQWMVGAGPEPVDPPSLWPGSQQSFDTGYLWLEVPQ